MNNEVKYNEYQLNYVNLKEQYDKAFEAGDWNAVEAIEDAYIDAELALIDWLESVVTESEQDGKQVKETYRLAVVQGKQEKIIDLALGLTA